MENPNISGVRNANSELDLEMLKDITRDFSISKEKGSLKRRQ